MILAQNERWRRGLGMQVARSFIAFYDGSNTIVESGERERQTGEEHVDNLPLSWGQPAERRANTELHYTFA